MGDETRNLISSAQSLIDKDQKPRRNTGDDSTAARLVAEADAISSRKARKDGPAPSTRQLVVEAEKLVGDRSAPKKGGSGTMLLVAAALLIGGIAVWFLMGR